MSTATEYKINFDDVKRSITMEQVVDLLNLQLKRTKPTQWKGDCPFCQKKDCFTINADGGRDGLGAFNCFRCPSGGDMLELVSLSRGNARKDRKGALAAAKELQKAFLGADRSVDRSPKQPETRRGFDAEAYGKTLDPEAEELTALGLAPETLRDWKAGYAKGGVNARRLALPLATPDGVVVAYAGLALNGEEPHMKYPEKVDPHHYLFGADRVADGELTIVGNPVQVLQAYENGMGNTCAFLTEALVVEQLEHFPSLPSRAGIPTRP